MEDDKDEEVSVKKALDAAAVFQQFVDRHGDETQQQAMLHLKCMLTESLLGSTKQAEITDFC